MEGEVFTRMIACIVLSSEYVLKIANSEDETCHFNIGQASTMHAFVYLGQRTNPRDGNCDNSLRFASLNDVMFKI